MANLYGGPGGPEPDGGDHALCGVYYGLVTQNKDPQNLARVKVSLKWLENGDIDQTFWAKVCVPMIGPEFGTYTLPEVGDQVLVVFVAGDVSMPMVIGGVWSNDDKPPATEVDHRLIRSRSGHDLLLNDKDGNIVLNSKTGSEVVACGAKSAGSKDGGSLTSDAGDLSVWCPAGTFKAEAKTVTVISTTSVDIKAGSDLEVSGSTNAAVSSTAIGKYEGSTTSLG